MRGDGGGNWRGGQKRMEERTGEGQEMTRYRVKRREGQSSGTGVHDSIVQYS